MRVLVACEYSGTVRDAFLDRGHYAMSCDLLPCESQASGDHYQGNVLDILDHDWDLMIAHPPCTYLTNSGVCHLHTDASRWAKLDQGAAFLVFVATHPPQALVDLFCEVDLQRGCCA